MTPLLLAPILAAAILSPAGEESGFEPLFNGKDFEGLRFFFGGEPGGPGETFRVEEGVIVCTGEPAGYMFTERDHGEFTLRFEWRYARPADLVDDGTFPGNSGYLLFLQEHKVWPRSLEVQGMHRTAGTIIPIDTKAEFTFDREAQGKATKPVGEWNEMEIDAAGGKITVRLNGTLVSTVAHYALEPGPIAFQSEGAEIHWRNLRIREKAPAATDAPAKTEAQG